MQMVQPSPKEQVQSGNFELKYLSTENIPADALTKALSRSMHIKHAEVLHNQTLKFLRSSL